MHYSSFCLRRFIYLILFIFSIIYSVVIAENRETTIVILSKYHKEINQASNLFAINARLLVSAIYADRRMNYNQLDENFDVLLALQGRNNSIGISQIRVSSAKWIYDTLKDSTSKYYLGSSYSEILPEFYTEKELITQLGEPKINFLFAAAYSAMLIKRWQSKLNLAENIEIFATLYNIGPYQKDGMERIPHDNPHSNEYGFVAKDFYYSKTLTDVFPL